MLLIKLSHIYSDYFSAAGYDPDVDTHRKMSGVDAGETWIACDLCQWHFCIFRLNVNFLC